MYLFKGKPSISYLIDSILQIFNKNKIFIATTDNPADTVIYEYCKDNNIHVFRGDEENVASRFINILKRSQTDYFIRLCGDSPLFDYRTVDSALKILQYNDFDLVSTSNKKSFPPGMHMEIVKTETFINEYKNFNTSDHFEHLTLYFYEKKNKFKIHTLEVNLKNPENYKFSFDTIEDKNRIEQFFNALEKPHYCYTLREKCKIYEQLFFRNNN